MLGPSVSVLVRVQLDGSIVDMAAVGKQGLTREVGGFYQEQGI